MPEDKATANGQSGCYWVTCLRPIGIWCWLLRKAITDPYPWPLPSLARADTPQCGAVWACPRGEENAPVGEGGCRSSRRDRLMLPLLCAARPATNCPMALCHGIAYMSHSAAWVPKPLHSLLLHICRCLHGMAVNGNQ